MDIPGEKSCIRHPYTISNAFPFSISYQSRERKVFYESAVVEDAISPSNGGPSLDRYRGSMMDILIYSSSPAKAHPPVRPCALQACRRSEPRDVIADQELVSSLWLPGEWKSTLTAHAVCSDGGYTCL